MPSTIEFAVLQDASSTGLVLSRGSSGDPASTTDLDLERRPSTVAPSPPVPRRLTPLRKSAGGRFLKKEERTTLDIFLLKLGTGRVIFAKLAN